MALVTPAAVHDSSSTSGTGSYSLTGDTETGRRSLADAVTDGDVSNSDEVYYFVFDSTTSGSSFEFEYGKGTVSSSGAALSRDSVLQSSNSGSKVSWGAGGTRSVIVTTGAWILGANNGSDFDSASTVRTNLDVPGLSTANTFTNIQVINRGASAGALWAGSDRTTGLCGNFDLFGDDSGGNFTLYSRIASNIVSSTDGAESGELRFSLTSGGSFVERLRLEHDGTLKNQSSGNSYDAFPSGFTMLAQSVPVGWSRSNLTGERTIRLAGSGDTAGATGGTWTVSGLSVSGTVAGHTLTESEIPSHTHTVEVVDSTGTQEVAARGGIDTGTSITSSLTGGDGSHNHGWSGSVSSNGTWRPAYEVWVRIVKD